MLGRQLRTTRLDVGLALAFAGVSYLVWALIAGGSRQLVQEFIKSAISTDMKLPALTVAVKVFFVDTGFVIDLVGLVWLAGTLTLVVLGSRQKISISWSWVSAICQASVAGLGAVLVGGAVYAPHVLIAEAASIQPERSIFEQVSEISLPVMVSLAILIWTTFLAWLLAERARLNRRGPTLRDGLRSNIFKT